jgi:hypothetical protein
MATTSCPHFGKLARDDRGVVAIIGLAMALFLTGLVYYEMGVGDAITFKEQLQDASDASGFAAAVYHAKGMNMIVLLNLIMAAVLAVIVLVRVLELVFGVVTGLVLGICWIPGMEWLCPVAVVTGDGFDWSQAAATTMDPIVRAALLGLNDVATVVAVGMPWVALVKSGTVGVQYYPQVTSEVGGGTIMLSMSLVPDLAWIPASNGASSAASRAGSRAMGAVGLGGGEEESESKVEDKRWGLPVQEGEFSFLCDQAAQVIPDLLEWAINAAVHRDANAAPPKWLSWLNNAIGAAIGSWPQFFCDESEMTSPVNASQVQKQAQTQCDDNETQWSACENAIGLSSGAFDEEQTGPCANGIGAQIEAATTTRTPHPKFDMKACLTKQTHEINDAATEANSGSAWKSAKSSALPKEIVPFAANGNDYMAIWSFGWGAFHDTEESGISIARWSNDRLVQPKAARVTMLTKAEFFYAVENPCTADDGKQDYGTKGSAPLCKTTLDMPYWGDYAADVMWNPRWKARLRRVSPPMIPIGQMASAGLQSLLGTALRKGIGMIPQSGGVSSGAGTDELVEYVTGWMQIGGGMADSAVAGQIEKAAGFLH